MKKLLAPLAVLSSLAVGAYAAPPAALEALLEAGASPAVFDGSRSRGGVVVPVAAPGARAAAAVLPRASSAQPPAVVAQAPSAAAPADVAPTPLRGLTGGYLGLYPESDFELGTGRCSVCRGPEEGKWYFLDDVIATPKSGPVGLVWIGSREMVEGARLSADGASVTLSDGSVLAFALVDRIPTNRSYYDAASLAYLRGRTVRIRGEFVEKDGVRTLVARTIWPEDYRIDLANLEEADVRTADDVDALVSADDGGAKAPFSTKLLWEKPGAGRAWEGLPVMGFMLNGAQGDDDEALAGHSSLFTGRVGAGGSMADWMFDNFYSMDVYSEKGIVSSLVPMDKYMADLNSGQSWYRPSYMLVMVMKDPRVPQRFQEAFAKQYADYYAQRVKYDKTSKNCTALIADPVRAEGWNLPEHGKTPKPVAKLFAAALKLFAGEEAAEQAYRSLREEPTRSFPRASFKSAGGDLLTLAGSFGADPLGRELTPLEKDLQEDLVALLFVRLPQIPSSRKSGRDPVGGVVDYMLRAPKDRADWQTVPSVPRPFPPPR